MGGVTIDKKNISIMAAAAAIIVVILAGMFLWY